MGAVGTALLAGTAPGTAPTDKGACRAVWAGICDNSDDSCCGVMTDASHKYSSSCSGVSRPLVCSFALSPHRFDRPDRAVELGNLHFLDWCHD